MVVIAAVGHPCCSKKSVFGGRLVMFVMFSPHSYPSSLQGPDRICMSVTIMVYIRSSLQIHLKSEPIYKKKSKYGFPTLTVFSGPFVPDPRFVNPRFCLGEVCKRCTEEKVGKPSEISLSPRRCFGPRVGEEEKSRKFWEFHIALSQTRSVWCIMVYIYIYTYI